MFYAYTHRSASVADLVRHSTLCWMVYNPGFESHKMQGFKKKIIHKTSSGGFLAYTPFIVIYVHRHINITINIHILRGEMPGGSGRIRT